MAGFAFASCRPEPKHTAERKPVPNFTAAIHAEARIFVLDDNPANLLFMEKLLTKAGYQNVECSSTPEEAESICRFFKPDLVILDLHMPGMSGFDVLERLRGHSLSLGFLPILVFSADCTGEARNRALELGANDFLTKPGDTAEITLRVRNFLEMRRMYCQMEDQNAILEQKVAQRTSYLLEAQLEIVERLAIAGDYRDDDTGEHCRRVGELCYEIAIEHGLPSKQADILKLAAPLHDIGKVGIPDAILRKKGKLSLEEFEEIKRHTWIGARILADSRTEILQVAHEIAMSHHERWDGEGYPQGLAGESIPLSGRIVAVADVFDALTHSRAYKQAWSQAAAVREISHKAGSQFDPEVVAAFVRVAKDRELSQAA